MRYLCENRLTIFKEERLCREHEGGCSGVTADGHTALRFLELATDSNIECSQPDGIWRRSKMSKKQVACYFMRNPAAVKYYRVSHDRKG